MSLELLQRHVLVKIVLFVKMTTCNQRVFPPWHVLCFFHINLTSLRNKIQKTYEPQNKKVIRIKEARNNINGIPQKKLEMDELNAFRLKRRHNEIMIYVEEHDTAIVAVGIRIQILGVFRVWGCDTIHIWKLDCKFFSIEGYSKTFGGLAAP